MQLTQEDLDEFKAIYRREFNTELTDAQALEVAHAALTLVQAVHRPLHPLPLEAQRQCLVEKLVTILFIRALVMAQEV